MGYYKPPTTFLLTLTLNAFLKTFFLRECKSYLKEASLSVSQMLFMSFLISCGVSLFSLMLSGKRKAWSYKLVAVIGGRENSPKLGPGLFAGSIYMIRVGGLIVGSILTSPFRAVMISEYISLCLSSSRSGSLGFSNLERKFQKLLVSLLPIAACLLFDYRNMAGTQLEEYIIDEVVPNLGIFSAQPDLKTHHTFETLAFGYFGITASSVAQCLLGWVFEPSISSSLTTTAIGRRAVTNQILFFSLVQGLAAVLLIPWLSSASIVPLGFGTLFLYLGICFTLNLCEVVNFRISKLLPAHQDLPWINWLVSVIGAMVYCMFCFQAPEDPKSLFSFSDLLLVFLALVTLFLTRPGPLDKVPSKPTGLLSGIKGTSNLRDNLGHFLTAILASQDSRQIFYFMLLNLSYMFVQLAYGFWTNSLGLISDAIHMFFDCVALGVGLFAAVTSKWPKNHQFSYGYSRIEVLSGFSNGIFLALISIFIVLEAVGRLIHPPEMNTDRLLLISFLGLVVNLVGILAFNHGHHHGHGHCHSHGEPSAHVHIEDHAHDDSHNHKHQDDHAHDHVHHTHSHKHHDLSHDHDHAHDHGHAHDHTHHDHDHAHDHTHHDHGHTHDHSHGHDHAHDHTHHDHGHTHDHSYGHDHTDIHVHQSNGGHNHDHGHGHSHNMEGVFLHIMADTLGSVGVIISTLLIKYFGWTGFDPIASIFIAVLIFFSVLPLIRSSFAILLLYVPPDVSNRLRQAASKTESSLGGACKVLDGKIWPNDHDSYIATISIELSPGINPTSVSPRIEKIFKEMLPSVKDLTLQFEVSN